MVLPALSPPEDASLPDESSEESDASVEASVLDSEEVSVEASVLDSELEEEPSELQAAKQNTHRQTARSSASIFFKIYSSFAVRQLSCSSLPAFSAGTGRTHLHPGETPGPWARSGQLSPEPCFRCYQCNICQICSQSFYKFFIRFRIFGRPAGSSAKNITQSGAACGGRYPVHAEPGGCAGQKQRRSRRPVRRPLLREGARQPGRKYGKNPAAEIPG